LAAIAAIELAVPVLFLQLKIYAGQSDAQSRKHEKPYYWKRCYVIETGAYHAD